MAFKGVVFILNFFPPLEIMETPSFETHKIGPPALPKIWWLNPKISLPEPQIPRFKLRSNLNWPMARFHYWTEVNASRCEWYTFRLCRCHWSCHICCFIPVWRLTSDCDPPPPASSAPLPSPVYSPKSMYSYAAKEKHAQNLNTSTDTLLSISIVKSSVYEA